MKKLLLFMIVCLTLSITLYGCSGGNSKDESGEETVTTEEEVESEEESEDEFDSEAIAKQIKITKLGSFTRDYSNELDRGYAAIAKNESDKAISLSATFVMKDSEGKPVGSVESEQMNVPAGASTLLFGCDEMGKYKTVEIELDVSEPQYEVLSDKLETESTLRSDQVIVQMKNTSDKDVEYACAVCAFLRGDKVVDCGEVYCTNDDSILPAGKTKTGTYDWINEEKVDKVKVFADGRGTEFIEE